jgi:single-strand DNA-binding protein
MNRTILIGYVGRDPEVKFLANGTPVANFSLATDDSYKDKNGEKQKRTDWHRIVIFGKLAEVVQKYVKKGAQLALEGKVQTRSWDGKDGEKKYSTEIVCHLMTMLDSKNGDTAEREEPRPPEAARANDAAPDW